MVPCAKMNVGTAENEVILLLLSASLVTCACLIRQQVWSRSTPLSFRNACSSEQPADLKAWDKLYMPADGVVTVPRKADGSQFTLTSLPLLSLPSNL